MNYPPPGYDDHTVIAQKRLKMLLDDFEGYLSKVQRIFDQHFPERFEPPRQMEQEYWLLRKGAEELGEHYLFLVEKLIEDYENFKSQPEQKQLDQIFSDLKKIELLLAG